MANFSSKQQPKFGGAMEGDDHAFVWPDHSYFAELLNQSLEHKQRRIYVTEGSYFGQHRVESADEIAHHHHLRTSPPTLTPSSSSPASWRTAGSQQLAALVSQRSTGRLVANCDLPPPSPEALGSKSASSSSQSSSVTQAHELLGEALCRSQTRAREAEKLAVRATQEKDQLMHLFVREASMSLAYRQWLISLQAENLCLKMCHTALPVPSKFHHHCPQLPTISSSKKCNYHHHHFRHHKRTKPERSGAAARPEDLLLRCTVAFALGLGLAGAGFMLGWSMGWIFFAF